LCQAEGRFRLALLVAGFFVTLPALEGLLAARLRGSAFAFLELMVLARLSFLNFFKSEGPNFPRLNPSAPATTTQIVGAISDNRLTKMTIFGVIYFGFV